MSRFGLLAALTILTLAGATAAPNAMGAIPPKCPSYEEKTNPACGAEWTKYSEETTKEFEEKPAYKELAAIEAGDRERAAAAEAEAARVQAEEQAAAAAKLHAEEEPVASIFATMRAHPRRDPTEPGYSTILVSTAPNVANSQVLVELKRGRGPTRRASGHSIEVAWPECDAAGMGDGFVVKYTIRARPRRGTAAWTVRSGHLVVGSAKRCTWLNRRAEREAARKIRAQQQRESRERLEERESLARWMHNCDVEGGTVVVLHTSEGSEWACRAPGGGLLPVRE